MDPKALLAIKTCSHEAKAKAEISLMFHALETHSHKKMKTHEKFTLLGDRRGKVIHSISKNEFILTPSLHPCKLYFSWRTLLLR